LEGAYELNKDTPMCLAGKIFEVNLVESTYSVGIYLSSSEFSGDLLNLASISVMPRKKARSVTPYPPHHRGYAEFDYEIQVISPSVQ
jgi:hypothetical protein